MRPNVDSLIVDPKPTEKKWFMKKLVKLHYIINLCTCTCMLCMTISGDTLTLLRPPSYTEGLHDLLTILLQKTFLHSFLTKKLHRKNIYFSRLSQFFKRNTTLPFPRKSALALVCYGILWPIILKCLNIQVSNHCYYSFSLEGFYCEFAVHRKAGAQASRYSCSAASARTEYKKV